MKIRNRWSVAAVAAALLAAAGLFAPGPAAAQLIEPATSAKYVPSDGGAEVMLVERKGKRLPPWLRRGGKGPGAKGHRKGPRFSDRSRGKPRFKRDRGPRIVFGGKKFRRDDRGFRPRKVKRRRKFLPPRAYRRHRHGRRARRRNRVFRFYYGGWWYANQWWLGYGDYRYRRGSCGYWKERCIDNWGYRNSDYYGCMRYHGCL